MDLSGPCDEVKDFFGVYLLVSHSEESKFRGRTYIGYTVDPNRRIKQHNKGTQSGGAKRTSNGGPWKMVLIVHGFPNSISALRFEWAWQQPKVSRRLKTIRGLDKRRSKESQFQHKFRILSEMLRIGPWNRLPLQIRWLGDEYFTDFPTLKPPPMHMIICCGRVVRSKRTAASEGGEQACSGLFGVVNRCTVCKKLIAANSSSLSCINKSCGMMAHLVCLAGEFLRDDSESILPIEGNCPGCRKRILWGDLIRRLNGALDLIEVPSDEEGADSGDNNCSDVALSDDSVVDGEVDGDVN